MKTSMNLIDSSLIDKNYHYDKNDIIKCSGAELNNKEEANNCINLINLGVNRISADQANLIKKP